VTAPAKDTPARPVVTFERGGHAYVVDGIRVPSVTQVVGILGSDGLAGWGQRIAVEGLVKLRELGIEIPANLDAIFALLKAHGLTTGAVAARARARGTVVHEALERVARGETFTADQYPAEHIGYVKALLAAIRRLRPAEWLGSEVVVGSRVHQYGGTYDALVVDHPGRRIRLDLKTNQRIYESHHLQLTAYELAARECGEEPSDYLVIVRLASDASYEFVRSRATFEQFLTVRRTFDAIRGLRETLHAGHRPTVRRDG
jgi:hypothetical protein